MINVVLFPANMFQAMENQTEMDIVLCMDSSGSIIQDYFLKHFPWGKTTEKNSRTCVLAFPSFCLIFLPFIVHLHIIVSALSS